MKIQIAVLFAYYMGCEATLCTEDFHVSNNACVECAQGQSNLAGDDPSGQDTSCDTCKITTNEELRDHIDLWIEMSDTATHPCGPIVGDWEVGRVTDMSYLFCALNETWTPLECNANRRSFNADISRWDVSNVTSLEGTFLGTTAFDLDRISQWDLTRVETFEKNTFTFLNPRNHICTKRTYISRQRVAYVGVRLPHIRL